MLLTSLANNLPESAQIPVTATRSPVTKAFGEATRPKAPLYNRAITEGLTETTTPCDSIASSVGEVRDTNRTAPGVEASKTSDPLVPTAARGASETARPAMIIPEPTATNRNAWRLVIVIDSAFPPGCVRLERAATAISCGMSRPSEWDVRASGDTDS